MIVLDGNEILKNDISTIAKLIERTAKWVHPETFRHFPVWCPYTWRGAPLYDAAWVRRYTNTRKRDGVTLDKSEGNVAALKAFMAALNVEPPRPKNWTVCHIWGYDDPTFSQQGSIVGDPKYFSCVGNMVWLPTPLKGFTDAVPTIKSMLRVCAFHLYGWVCDDKSVKDAADQIKTGWVPEHYPETWPSPWRPDIHPNGISAFNETVMREIKKRKEKIKSDLENPGMTYYPRDKVRAVLEHWKIDLNSYQ